MSASERTTTARRRARDAATFTGGKSRRKSCLQPAAQIDDRAFHLLEPRVKMNSATSSKDKVGDIVVHFIGHKILELPSQHLSAPCELSVSHGCVMAVPQNGPRAGEPTSDGRGDT